MSAGFLHFYLSSILKGKTDIFFIKNCDKINQTVPLLFIKLRGHAILPLQFCNEPFYLFPFRLLLSDGIADLILFRSQDIDCFYKKFLDGFFVQMRCATFLAAVKFVVALPDHPSVFIVGVPYF